MHHPQKKLELKFLTNNEVVVDTHTMSCDYVEKFQLVFFFLYINKKQKIEMKELLFSNDKI